MARSNKRCGEIYKEMWFLSKNKEWDRSTSRKVDDK